MSGIWAEVWPVETAILCVGAHTFRPEYGPKSGPLRHGDVLSGRWGWSGIWAEVWPVETHTAETGSTFTAVRNMGRSLAR